jgi:regulator of replication initiation timing
MRSAQAEVSELRTALLTAVDAVHRAKQDLKSARDAQTALNDENRRLRRELDDANLAITQKESENGVLLREAAMKEQAARERVHHLQMSLANSTAQLSDITSALETERANGKALLEEATAARRESTATAATIRKLKQKLSHKERDYDNVVAFLAGPMRVFLKDAKGLQRRFGSAVSPSERECRARRSTSSSSSPSNASGTEARYRYIAVTEGGKAASGDASSAAHAPNDRRQRKRTSQTVQPDIEELVAALQSRLRQPPSKERSRPAITRQRVGNPPPSGSSEPNVRLVTQILAEADIQQRMAALLSRKGGDGDESSSLSDDDNQAAASR